MPSVDEVTKTAVRCSGTSCTAITGLERRYQVSSGKRYLWWPEAPGWTVLGSGHALCPGCSSKEAA